MQTNCAIKVNNVSKSFHIPAENRNSIQEYFLQPFKKVPHSEIKVLNQISFEVKKGTFFTIIGQNGSGKSTLLKIIAGIYEPDVGTVEIDGKMVPFLELGVGFNPQLSGRDNIFLNGTMLGMSRSYLKAKFQEIVSFAEIENFIDMPLKNYSSGMLIRLAFSIAFISQADIFLLDEVFAVGDINFQKKCLEVLLKLKAEGKTIVLVTHSLDLMKQYSDEVLFLDRGKKAFIEEAVKADFLYRDSMLKEEEKVKSLPAKEIETTAVESPKQERDPVNHIEALHILNQDGQECRSFQHGENLSLKIFVNVQSHRENLYLQVCIFSRQTRDLLTDNNSHEQENQIAWELGQNVIQINFSDINFHKGEFFVQVVLGFSHLGKAQLEDIFDSHEKGIFFSYSSKKDNAGLITLKQSWHYNE